MAPVHGDWLGGCIHGHTIIMRLMRDPKHRSDQWAAELDGATVEDAAGLTRLHNLLRSRWPRSRSKRDLASDQQQWTARDEVDAMSAQTLPT